MREGKERSSSGPGRRRSSWRRLARHAGARLLDVAGDALGEVAPPPRRLVRSSGWRPDPAGTWCLRCGDPRAPGEADAQGRCAACRRDGTVADLVIRLGMYEDPLRAWVLAVKHGPRLEELGHELGRLLARQVRRTVDLPDARDRLAGAGRDGIGRAIVTAVPMPPARRWHRGIDHAAVIAAGVAAGLDRPLVRLLARGAEPSQAGRSRTARRRGGGRSMHRARGAALPAAGTPVILVDDVRTTGTTARRARARLRRLGLRPVLAAFVCVAAARANGGAAADSARVRESSDASTENFDEGPVRGR